MSHKVCPQSIPRHRQQHTSVFFAGEAAPASFFDGNFGEPFWILSPFVTLASLFGSVDSTCLLLSTSAAWARKAFATVRIHWFEEFDSSCRTCSCVFCFFTTYWMPTTETNRSAHISALVAIALLATNTYRYVGDFLLIITLRLRRHDCANNLKKLYCLLVPCPSPRNCLH